MLTVKELRKIYLKVCFRTTVSELCLLVYMLMTTRLKMCDLLGWFNQDIGQRRKYLRDLNVLAEYELVPKLFTRKHQTYLLQWKKACESWIGKRVTFELLRKSCEHARLYQAERFLEMFEMTQLTEH